MDVKTTEFLGLLVIHPKCFRDDRGFFLESFQAKRYHDAGIADTFVQDNHSRSRHRVLRGMHFQVKHPQAQIVTVIRGCIFDVAVDLRRSSPSFGRWQTAQPTVANNCRPRSIEPACSVESAGRTLGLGNEATKLVKMSHCARVRSIPGAL